MRGTITAELTDRERREKHTHSFWNSYTHSTFAVMCNSGVQQFVHVSNKESNTQGAGG